MRSKQDILSRIYKACFINSNVKEALLEDWGYVARHLEEDNEEAISLEILCCIDAWLDEEFDF